jgi:hypothetical protein
MLGDAYLPAKRQQRMSTLASDGNSSWNSSTVLRAMAWIVRALGW